MTVRAESDLQSKQLAHSKATEHLAALESELAQVMATITDLEARAGAHVAQDPATLRAMGSEIAGLRTSLELLTSASEDARTTVERCVREVLLAEADELDELVTAAQAPVTEHQARTRDLLAALVAHTHQFWRPEPLAVHPEDQDHHGGTNVPCRVSALDLLMGEVERARRAPTALRAVAAGRHPSQVVEGLTWDDLPASLRAGGIADLGWQSPQQRQAAAKVRADKASRIAAHAYSQYEAALRAYEHLAGELQERPARRGENLAQSRQDVEDARAAYFKVRPLNIPGAIDPGPAPDLPPLSGAGA